MRHYRMLSYLCAKQQSGAWGLLFSRKSKFPALVCAPAAVPHSACWSEPNSHSVWFVGRTGRCRIRECIRCCAYQTPVTWVLLRFFLNVGCEWRSCHMRNDQRPTSTCNMNLSWHGAEDHVNHLRRPASWRNVYNESVTCEG